MSNIAALTIEIHRSDFPAYKIQDLTSRCGSTFNYAMQNCGKICSTGSSSECPGRQQCFSNMPVDSLDACKKAGLLFNEYDEVSLNNVAAALKVMLLEIT